MRRNKSIIPLKSDFGVCDFASITANQNQFLVKNVHFLSDGSEAIELQRDKVRMILSCNYNIL
jgi:hypothetical protein